MNLSVAACKKQNIFTSKMLIFFTLQTQLYSLKYINTTSKPSVSLKIKIFLVKRKQTIQNTRKKRSLL